MTSDNIPTPLDCMTRYHCVARQESLRSRNHNAPLICNVSTDTYVSTEIEYETIYPTIGEVEEFINAVRNLTLADDLLEDKQSGRSKQGTSYSSNNDGDYLRRTATTHGKFVSPSQRITSEPRIQKELTTHSEHHRSLQHLRVFSKGQCVPRDESFQPKLSLEHLYPSCDDCVVIWINPLPELH